MAVLEVLQGAAGILGGLGGLFGKKKKNPTPAQNIMSQAQGARQASEKYGFNPLTLLQYGQTAGAMGGGGDVPPLASIDLITGGLSKLDDVFSGDADRRRAADRLNLDLAQLKLDQARSGVVAVAPSAASGVGSGGGALGGRTVAVAPASGRSVPPLSMAAGYGRVAPVQETVIQGVGGDADLISAQTAEDDFGELPGWAQGIFNLGKVAFRNWNDPMREEAYDGGFYPKSDLRKSPPPRRPKSFRTGPLSHSSYPDAVGDMWMYPGQYENLNYGVFR